MGHSTHIAEISQEELDSHTEWRKNEGIQPSYSLFGRMETKEDILLRMAISDWSNDPDSDRGHAYGARAEIVSPLPEEVAWGPNTERDATSERSFIIPLIHKDDYEIKETIVTVKMDAAEWKKLVWSYNSTLLKKVIELKPTLDGSIIDLRTVAAASESTIRGRGLEEWNISSTIKADTSGGKTKNVYYLTSNDRPVGLETYSSQALARAAATELFSKRPDILNLEVVAKVVREDGSPLVSLHREVKSSTAKIAVRYAKSKSKTPRIKGYLVGFDYHH